MNHPLAPIGVFRCAATYPYDAARQAVVAAGSGGEVHLNAGSNFEQALLDLDGFSRIWLVYLFHHNPNWKPLVSPPRGARKVGVFASRAPYRPNPIGLSCVELVAVRGRVVEVGAHDLLDGTPILDIKPYLPYADSFPQAAIGWVEEVDTELWNVVFSAEAQAQITWLTANGCAGIETFLLQQLREHPLDQQHKRVRPLDAANWEIAYRTWRARFRVEEEARQLAIKALHSGYSAEDLANTEDRYGDKELHRDYNKTFAATSKPY
jgi:tRNA-Thr(GGU) m(6)t(6)A37 methyltransferase TsaA